MIYFQVMQIVPFIVMTFTKVRENFILQVN